MKKNLVILMAIAIVFAVGGVVYAASSTPQVNVSATISGLCTVSGSGTINFGTLNSIEHNAGVTATGVTAPSIYCVYTTPVTVTDDMGMHEAVSDTAPARMTDGSGHYINYAFTYDSSLTGEGPSVDIGDGGTGHLNLAASIPAGALTGAVPGSYTDVITLTISY